jgi:hypothetical protein
MELINLRTLLQDKTEEFERAMEEKKPHFELLRIFKEIKLLFNEISQNENNIEYISE